MKKIVNSIWVLAVITLLSSCEKDLMKEINDGDWNNERNVLSINLEEQIGLSIIERTEDMAVINITVNASGLDLSSVDITDMVLSYDASSDVGVGDKLNFDNEENKASIKVISKKGKSLEWTIFIEPFVNEIEGSWTISSYFMKWDDGNCWGNAGESELVDLLPLSSPGLDDIITFGPVEGANEDGLVYGNYERTMGADGEVASFIYERTNEDWAVKYDQIPVGVGEWMLNKDNSIAITVNGTTYTTKIFEKIDETNLKVPLDPGALDHGRINWDDYYGDNTNKFCVTTELFYSLTKQ